MPERGEPGDAGAKRDSEARGRVHRAGAAFNREGDRPRGCFRCAVSAAHVLGDGEPQGVDHRGSLASDVEPDGAIAGLFAMLDTDLANDAGDKLAAAHALSLLGNCAVDAKARIARARAVGADAPGKIARVLRCGTPVLAERAATLLGNMCADGRMRAEFAANERGISDLCALLPKNEKNERATSVARGDGRGPSRTGRTRRGRESDAPIDPSPVRDSSWC